MMYLLKLEASLMMTLKLQVTMEYPLMRLFVGGHCLYARRSTTWLWWVWMHQSVNLSHPVRNYPLLVTSLMRSNNKSVRLWEGRLLLPARTRMDVPVMMRLSDCWITGEFLLTVAVNGTNYLSFSEALIKPCIGLGSSLNQSPNSCSAAQPAWSLHIGYKHRELLHFFS